MMSEAEQIQIDFERKLTFEEQKVWDVVRFHRGKENAILGTLIASMTGIEYDRVREIISHLVNEHGYLIGSYSRGYFVCVTAKEVAAATKSLRHRALCILWRASRLQKTSLVEVFNQSLLEFKKNVDSP